MANSFNELMQDFVNTDYSKLVAMAGQAMANLIPVCKQVDPDNDGFMMLSSIVLAAVGADGKLSGMEKQFLCDVMGLDGATVDKYIGMYNANMPELVDRFVDTLGGDIKNNAVMLVCCIAACDETISREETAFIRKLLA